MIHPGLKLIRRISVAASLFLLVMSVGTAGYWHIGEGRYSVLDAFYMTFITVATIGYGEIVDLSQSPGGRIFTMVIAFCGIALMTYIMSMVTALIVEGEMNAAFRRRREKKMIDRLRNHFIVCGMGRVGTNVVKELQATHRAFVIIDPDRLKATNICGEDCLWIEGDAADDDALLQAGIERAAGLFAVTNEDHRNLVVTLSAKHLNPSIRVVARCHDIRNTEKMRKVGADAIVSPDHIGGLRIASEMVRPTVVSFLDQMLRDHHEGLRIEEWLVTQSMAGKSLLDALDLDNRPGTLVLAMRNQRDEWTFNPRREQLLTMGDTLVLMCTPEDRKTLQTA